MHRTPHALRLVPALVVALLLAQPLGVQAAQYTSASNHYRFTVPDDWTQTTFPGADVVFLGPVRPGFTPNLNVVTAPDSTAKSSSSWLLAGSQAGYEAILGSLPDATVVQEPRSFTTGSGRLAADYVFDYNQTSNWLWLRMRQVVFASDAWDRAYILTFTASQWEYDSFASVWTQAVDSFEVTDESSAGSGLLPLVIAITVGAVIALTLAAVVVRRRRRKVPAPITPPPLAAPPPGGSSVPPLVGPPPPPPVGPAGPPPP